MAEILTCNRRPTSFLRMGLRAHLPCLATPTSLGTIPRSLDSLTSFRAMSQKPPVAQPLAMSFLWHFSSYDHAKLDSLNGPVIADALLWDDGAFDDVPAVHRLAKHIATSGFSYADLPPADCQLLDELIPLLFSPEGLESSTCPTPLVCLGWFVVVAMALNPQTLIATTSFYLRTTFLTSWANAA